jgi:hypothetical protein
VLLVVELILAVRIHGLSRVICSRLDVRELLVLCVDVIYAGSKRRSVTGQIRINGTEHGYFIPEDFFVGEDLDSETCG